MALILSRTGDVVPDTTTAIYDAGSDQRFCSVCRTSFVRIRRQQFCSDGCRKSAWVGTRKGLAD